MDKLALSKKKALSAHQHNDMILAVLNQVLRWISDSGTRSTKKTKMGFKKSSKK